MFVLDQFLSDCVAASREPEPRSALKEVLTRAVADDAAMASALNPTKAGIDRLHVSDDLSVLNVVWGPDMRIQPHDHRMWAAIGMYCGGEDNTFFRRADGGLIQSGGKELRPRDSVLLGDATIHAVHNPTDRLAGAIHIYGGDFFTTPRSEWDPVTLEERPYDVDRVLRSFAEANARLET